MPELIALRRRRRPLAREDGIALVVAMGMLLVIGIIATGVTALAVQVKTETSKDRDAARALSAAESGLRLGTYYLNQSLPIADTACPDASNPATQTTASGSPLSCPSATAPYTVTNPDGTVTKFFISGGTTTAPLKCSGAAQPDTSARPGLKYHQRCITATGTSGSVTRRVQARVLASSYIFPIPGMVGIDHITFGTGSPSGTGQTASQCNANLNTVLSGGSLTGTMLVEGSLGTNGTARTVLNCWGGSVTDLVGANSSRLYMGLDAPTTSGGLPNPQTFGAQPGGVVRMTTPLSIPPIDTIFQAGEGGYDSATAQGNDNATGMSMTPILCSPNTYDAVRRTLNLSSTCVISLQGSSDINNPKIYNFCQISYPANGGTIQLPILGLGGYVRLLIDSPNRGTSSGCADGTGGLDMKNGGSILANATASVGAQIFIYGVTKSQGVTVAPGTGINNISWQNSGNLKTLLVAPQAKITFQNNAVITGGVAAFAVETQNNLVYIWDQNVDSVERRSLYYRVAYSDCSTTATVAGDPSSGC